MSDVEHVDGARDRQSIVAPGYDSELCAAHDDLDRADFPARLLRNDSTLWRNEPAHQAIIKNALGFLTVPETMSERVGELAAFALEVKDGGFRDVVLLGMGGSSQTAALFADTFTNPGFPKLHVLDSTVPETIRTLVSNIDIARTLFVVASKTGDTIETLSYYNAFFERVKATSSRPAGSHFVVITDPGTNLETIARERKSRRLFLNPPDMIGCYAALSYFGLVPAALIGIDVATLLDRAIAMKRQCTGSVAGGENAGVKLGAALGALLEAGRDKLTFIISPAISAFGLWVEQLVAECTGNEGKGIVPVCDEPLVEPGNYGKDRLFVYLKLETASDYAQEVAFEAVKKAGFPTVQITLSDKNDLGGEFMRWEVATVTAAAVLGLDPFDQPNVQKGKDNTSRRLKEFERTHSTPEPSALAKKGPLAIFVGDAVRDSMKGQSGFREIIGAYMRLARPHDYFATMAYVSPSPGVDREIAAIRKSIVERLGIATTFGYGPRILHSTGQLHKGGPNSGLFLQITQDHRDTIPIPGVGYDFARLNQAQYLGDFESLEAHGRRVMRVHLAGEDPIGALKLLREEIVEALAK